MSLDDIGMIQECLNFELSDELREQVVLNYFLFVHYFQGDYHPCVQVTS